MYMGFSQKEYWNALLFHSPGDLPHPGIELESPASPVLASELFTTQPSRKPLIQYYSKVKLR